MPSAEGDICSTLDWLLIAQRHLTAPRYRPSASEESILCNVRRPEAYVDTDEVQQLNASAFRLYTR
jgi:hypothetical protein